MGLSGLRTAPWATFPSLTRSPLLTGLVLILFKRELQFCGSLVAVPLPKLMFSPLKGEHFLFASMQEPISRRKG